MFSEVHQKQPKHSRTTDFALKITPNSSVENSTFKEKWQSQSQQMQFAFLLSCVFSDDYRAKNRVFLLQIQGSLLAVIFFISTLRLGRAE